MNWRGFGGDSFRSRGRGASLGPLYRAGGAGRGRSSFSQGYGGRSDSRSDADGSIHSASSSADRGTETPRVAIIGTGSRVFDQWWAIHAGGLRVGVVVGTGDAKVSHSSHSLKGTAVEMAVTDAEKNASAEAARVAASRCVHFYSLPEAKRSSTTQVRVCVSDDMAGEAVTTSTIQANARAAPGSTEEKDCVIATSWCFFFKSLLSTQSAAAGKGGGSSKTPIFSTSRTTSTGIDAWRPGAMHTSLTGGMPGNPPRSLVDDVEVVYLVDYGSDCDEAGLRVMLLWLLERDKQIIVECALSSETLATCAAAAAGSMRGQSEMKRLFLYRGGGCRRGWSVTAVAQLRQLLGVRRATATSHIKGPAASSSAKIVFGGDNIFAKHSTRISAPATDGDGGFSLFDLGDSSLGSALQDAENSKSSDGGVKPQVSVDAKKTAEGATVRTFATAASIDPESKNREEAKPESRLPAPTSVALDAATSVVGAVRHMSMVAIGAAGCLPAGSATVASLGIMGTLGWDAVAFVLHLLDWTCPDMVVGRVLRRACDTHEPLCVQAEMYYGIEGTAVGGGGTGKTVSTPTTPLRPSYLSISLYVATPDSSVLHPIDEDADNSAVFQQSLRIVGTTAVLTVDSPLLPTASTTNTGSVVTSTTTATADLATGGSSSSTPSVSLATLPSQAFSAASTVTPTGTGAAPAAPKVSYSYRLATQDLSLDSGQRERCVKHVTVGNAEACAELRVWQHVRSQLSVSAASSMSSAGMGFGGSSMPYASRYANRGGGFGFSAGYGSYDRARGVHRRGTASVSVSEPSVTAQVVAAGSAAQDVTRSWLVQKVVESILASAARLPS